MCSSLNIQRLIPLNTFKYWKINHKEDFDDIELLIDKPSYIDITDVTPPPPPPTNPPLFWVHSLCCFFVVEHQRGPDNRGATSGSPPKLHCTEEGAPAIQIPHRWHHPGQYSSLESELCIVLQLLE